MAKPARPKPFKERMDELQGLVDRLESGELSLEDAIAEFEKGRRLHASLLAELAGYEKRVETLLAGDASTAEPASDQDHDADGDRQA